MGLLAEKQSRSRINKDPNNTKWTRDTKTFGQKILRAQGWQPGQFLGAQDAAHSELHTAANASYIRVSLKDDMKGLGYNRAKEDEITGLDVFSDLLSRLNGKSEDAVEEDQQARLVVKTNRYVEARFGPMRFVRGGLLVGDEMKFDTTEEDSTATSDAEMPDADEKPKKSKKDKKSKKRKAADLEESGSESSSADAEKKEKKRRKEERKAKKLAAAETEENTPDEDARSKKKSKKEKSKSKTSSEAEDETVESKKSKKEKKEKKDKKKRKKEEAEAGESDSAAASVPTSAVATGTSTPTGSGTGTSTPRGSRNFVRSRFIAQKRQAVLDTKALAQIFMVKT